MAGHDVAVTGSTATVRANLIAMHLYEGSNQDASKPDNFFVAGGIVTAELKHSDGKWKISLLTNNVVWRGGNGAKLQELFKNMAKGDQ